MRSKKIKCIIFAMVLLIAGIIIWNKINHKSTEEICQEKAEQFYENQESFEKIIAYVNDFDFRSITENNEMWGDVIVDGVKFMLQDGESNNILDVYSRKTLLSQVLESDENALVIKVIGDGSGMDIYYDKKIMWSIVLI